MDGSESTVERLKRYVAIRSLSREEGVLADCVQGELEAAGLTVRRSGNNLWCEIGDAQRPRLLLNSHLDTVPPADGWTADPWTPREVDGRIIGLGANDAKGCVVAMIEAFLAIHRRLNSVVAASSRSSESVVSASSLSSESVVSASSRSSRQKDRSETGPTKAPPKPLGGTLILALTAEEEISGAGLSTIRESLEPIDAAIVGEPTGLTPMIAQRGLLILRGVARGRSGHPANTPADTADNAIVNASREILRLREFDWGPEHPLLGRCHAHVTQIAGGVARNVIPDSCEFYLDIRTTPAESHDALYDRLRRFLGCELHVHSKRLVPVETFASHPVVRVATVLAERPAAGSRAMSDMVFFSGVPSVKVGPGESSRSHTPDEYITAAELAAGATFYERVVTALFDLHHALKRLNRKADFGAPADSSSDRGGVRLALRQVLNRHDPARLLVDGNPGDEYAGECELLAATLREGMSVTAAQIAAYEVFVRSFDAATAGPVEGYRPIAEDLLGVMAPASGADAAEANR